MKPHIKSHFQLAKIPLEEVNPIVNIPTEGGRSTVLKQVKSLHIKRHLLEANKNLETFIGDQNTDTDDLCGRVLRRLRIQKGLEASVVASHACITVWQLYELETGKDTLFYTPGLRHRAAERVADFLGTDWSEILLGRVIVRAVPTPTAQLHLLKTRRADAGSNTLQANLVNTVEMGHPADEGASEPPLSTAMFLRVPDIRDTKSQ
jgi:hypothetical protein